MELAIISDEISNDFEHSLKVIRELGATSVEVRNLWGKNVVDLSQSQLEELRRLVKAYGLRLSNVDSAAFKTYLHDEESIENHLRMLQRAVEISRYLDLTFTRIFTFWWEGSLAKAMPSIVGALQRAAEIASAQGVTLAIENEYSTYTGTGEETARIVKQLRSPWVKVLWDPGNAFFAREEPYPEGYAQVRDNVIHVHLKDAKVIDGEFRWMPIGSGDIDFKGQLRELKTLNITASLETHYAPSGDKERGTRESFAGLLKTISALEG
ncbi:MAG: sugar phosphate isomerase/epimerase family protein [Thermoprotei archaeon]